MSLIKEYIGMSANNLEAELFRLVSMYNDKTDTYLVIYASALSKSEIPDTLINMDDYYTIFDLLRDVDKNNVAFYIETPGGSGEAAEEIGKCLRKKFDNINFVISGEAKSAGTILVLSGNEISMTHTGSLGPIDAQIPIGRSRISAYDYLEWVKKIQAKAEKDQRLNPFDATIVAQISPGELGAVENSLKFAEDLVAGWLPKYKFKDWNQTETKKSIVTYDMKLERARGIAAALTNHGKWRSHGRSLKIEELEEIGLKINKIDEDPDLADIVYRIQTIIKMLFNSSNTHKIFVTVDEKLFRTAIQIQTPTVSPPEIHQNSNETPDAIEIKLNCSHCNKEHNLYVKFSDNQDIDKDQKIKGNKPFPEDNKLLCDCGYEIDLSGIKNDLETKLGKKIVY